MLPYKYSYLVGCLVFLFIWLIIFISKPKLRTEMLIMGALGLIIGPIINSPLFLKDWWNPPYITGTKGGIEDFILGFTNISLASVIYKVASNRYFSFKNPISIKSALFRSFMFSCITLLPSFISFYILHLHSFWSICIGLLIGGLYILYKRLDLLKTLLGTALLLPLISFPAFLIAEYFSPGWIEKYWYTHNLSNITLGAVPIEDLIWYMFSGFCFGGIYIYVFNLETAED